MWVALIGPHYGIVNTDRLDAIKVHYKGPCLYHIVGECNGASYVLGTAQNEFDAQKLVEGFEDDFRAML